jgi:hypothetical protein
MKQHIPGTKSKVNMCKTCNEPIFDGYNRKYCKECRSKIPISYHVPYHVPYHKPYPSASVIEKKLGRPLNRVELYLLKHDQIDLIFVD